MNILRNWEEADFRGVDLARFAQRFAAAPDQPFVRTMMLLAILFQLQRRRIPVSRVLAWLGPPEWFAGGLRRGFLYYRLRTPPPERANTPHCLLLIYLNGWIERGGTNALRLFNPAFTPRTAALPEARRVLDQLAATRPNAWIQPRPRPISPPGR